MLAIVGDRRSVFCNAVEGRWLEARGAVEVVNVLLLILESGAPIDVVDILGVPLERWCPVDVLGLRLVTERWASIDALVIAFSMTEGGTPVVFQPPLPLPSPSPASAP